MSLLLKVHQLFGYRNQTVASAVRRK